MVLRLTPEERNDSKRAAKMCGASWADFTRYALAQLTADVRNGVDSYNAFVSKGIGEDARARRERIKAQVARKRVRKGKRP